jgi:predicted DNA-binding transcriptional regulator AlpA
MSALRLEAPEPGPMEPPPDRGQLLTAREAAELIGGGVSEAWVRRNAPHKVTLGHRTVMWYEADVRAWLESLRAS